MSVGGGYVQRVLAGCRYRACPTPGRGAMLARTSGHAPVVFNDVLRTRQDAHTAGEDQRHAGAAHGRRPRKDHRGPAVAGRGRAGGARGGLPGRAGGVPELVRLPVRCRQGPQGRTPPVPVPDPADPQRLGRRRRWCAGCAGRRRPAGAGARSARCAIWCHRHREAGARHCASFVAAVGAAPPPARTSDVGIDPGLARLAVLPAGEVRHGFRASPPASPPG
jgi:Helix-turn-helix domain